MEPLIRPTTLVDSHIHLFNARYLPLKAIIKRVPIVRLIAIPLSKILYAITDDFNLSPVTEDFVKSDIETSKEEIIQWFINRTQSKLSEEMTMNFNSVDLQAKLRASEIFTGIQELGEVREIEQTGFNTFNSDEFLYTFANSIRESSFTETDSQEAFMQSSENTYHGILKWAFEKLSSKEAEDELKEYIDTDGNSILTFLRLMLSNEAKIYERAKNGYGDAPLSLLVHHMMDMKASYLEGKTYYPFHPIQTDHMMQLVNASRGKLIGFTAFNPKNSDAMSSVKEGLTKGNIGVKFYPPMGYKPYGDADDSVRNNVSEFFNMCRNDSIPIFTHCTPVGFQAAKGYGLNCNPDYWEQLLEQAGNEKLRICFGHAGGGDPKINGHDFHGWYSNEDQWKSNDCYARKIVDLCQRFENVYCEIAYLDEILKGNEKKDLFVANLIQNFDNEAAEFKLKDKICFGTDWHMLEMVNAQEEYYNAFVLIFQDKKLIESLDKFFSENFIKFLNIPSYLDKTEKSALSYESKTYLKKLHEEALSDIGILHGNSLET